MYPSELINLHGYYFYLTQCLCRVFGYDVDINKRGNTLKRKFYKTYQYAIVSLYLLLIYSSFSALSDDPRNEIKYCVISTFPNNTSSIFHGFLLANQMLLLTLFIYDNSDKIVNIYNKLHMLIKSIRSSFSFPEQVNTRSIQRNIFCTFITFFLYIYLICVTWFVYCRIYKINGIWEKKDTFCVLQFSLMCFIGIGGYTFHSLHIMLLMRSLLTTIKIFNRKVNRKKDWKFADVITFQHKFANVLDAIELFTAIINFPTLLIFSTIITTETIFLYMILFINMPEYFLHFLKFAGITLILVTISLSLIYIPLTIELSKLYYSLYSSYFKLPESEHSLQIYNMMQVARVNVSCMGYFIFDKAFVIRLVGFVITQVLVLYQTSLSYKV